MVGLRTYNRNGMDLGCKFTEKGVHKGRVITPKGRSFLDKIAIQMKGAQPAMQLEKAPAHEVAEIKHEQKAVKKAEEPSKEAAEQKQEAKAEAKPVEQKKETAEVKHEQKAAEKTENIKQ